MPQGKGTYGSTKGRPPKKTKEKDNAYGHGGKVMPSFDSRSRSVKEYAGGGHVGFSSIGKPMGYNKGGNVGGEWEDVEGGARILRFNNDNKASGINPAIGEAAKKVGKFIKKASKDVGDAIQKGRNKIRKKNIDKTTERQDKRIKKHKEQEALIAADDKARKERKEAAKKKKEEEEKKKNKGKV
tara:strand:- start:660 stop:1211 length:552 start_codon:yes stop_codon:yes gene_type:complete